MSIRSQTLLEGITKSHKIIEIGASYNPLAPKKEGWDTKTIDHADRESLIKKYTGNSDVDVNRIEEVDFIWTQGLPSSAVPQEFHHTFDIFIASHVIEHSTDLLGFLKSAEILLKPTGTVILAVPDKRYCFDYFRQLTTTGEVLAAHQEKRSRHPFSKIFDHRSGAVQNGDVYAWGQSAVGELTLSSSIDQAYSIATEASLNNEYCDAHAWIFTPASFQLLLLELAWLKKTDWYVKRITPAMGCEFYTWLKNANVDADANKANADADANKANADADANKANTSANANKDKVYAVSTMTNEELNQRRLALHKQVLLELKEQIDYLLNININTKKPESRLKRLKNMLGLSPRELFKKIITKIGLSLTPIKSHIDG